MTSRAQQIIDEAIAKETRTAFGSYQDTMTPVMVLNIAKQAFAAYEAEYLVPYAKTVDQLKERVNVLNGTQNATSIPRSAVRFEDLRYLKDMPSVTKSRPAGGATPTKAEFDALHADVRMLIEALGSVGMIVGRKNQ